MNAPLVSIIIPIRKLSYSLIFENLPAFRKQTFKKFEVIVLPNQPAQYDITLLKTYKPWLRIIPTGKITRPAEKRNLGAKNARGQIIAFIDDDAYPVNDWLKNALVLFKKRKIAAVCGPGILPAKTNSWEKIFDEILKTWVGSGRYTYRFLPEKERFVDDYPSMNFFIAKKTFLKLGGFKGDYWPGEDSKLCEKLVYKKKGVILYSPKVVAYHHRRKNLKDYLQQHANYGFHRGAFFAHGDRNSRRLAYLIPTLFVIYLLFSFFFLLNSKFQILYSIFYIPLLLYLSLMLYLLLRALINTKNLSIALASPFVLLLTHFIYGIMFVKGVLKGIKSKSNIYA